MYLKEDIFIEKKNLKKLKGKVRKKLQLTLYFLMIILTIRYFIGGLFFKNESENYRIHLIRELNRILGGKHYSIDMPLDKIYLDLKHYKKRQVLANLNPSYNLFNLLIYIKNLLKEYRYEIELVEFKELQFKLTIQAYSNEIAEILRKNINELGIIEQINIEVSEEEGSGNYKIELKGKFKI